MGVGDVLAEGKGLEDEEADGDGEGSVETVGVGVGLEDADGEGVGVVAALGLTDGLGVALTTALTEAFGLGEGDSLGEGLGVGVSEGDGEGELASPKTFLPKLGRKIDFKNNPEPPRIKSRTTERMRVGLEGLFSAIICIITLQKSFWLTKSLLKF